MKTLVLCAVVGMTGGAAHAATELISNGGFEAGNLSGWTVFNQAGGNGNFFIDNNSGATPFSSIPTVGASTGNWYAVSDQGGPGTHALFQTIVVPAGATSVIFSFDMFVNDRGFGPIINPVGLDYTATSNQHARVDLMKSTAAPLSTAFADVITNFYQSIDPGPDPHAYTSYSFDITAVVSGGGTFNIRFAEVDNRGNLNQGVDNVSVLMTTIIPLPTPLGMGLAGFGVLAMTRRRR